MAPESGALEEDPGNLESLGAASGSGSPWKGWIRLDTPRLEIHIWDLPIPDGYRTNTPENPGIKAGKSRQDHEIQPSSLKRRIPAPLRHFQG